MVVSYLCRVLSAICFATIFLFSVPTFSTQLYTAYRISHHDSMIGIYTGINARPGARYCPGSFVLNNEFWLYGGYGNADGTANGGTLGPLNDLWKFSPSTKSWTYYAFPGTPTDSYFQNGGSLSRNVFPGDRYCMSDRWKNVGGTDPIVFGGSRLASPPTVMNDVWTYNAASGWTRLWPAYDVNVDNIASNFDFNPFPASRSRAGNWRVDDVMYLFGGSQGTTVFNDTWKYLPASNTWTPIYSSNPSDPLTNPPTRFGPASWVDNNKYIWMWGGLTSSSGPALNDMWRFNPTLSKWDLMAQGSTVPDARFGSTAWVSQDGSLILFGGNALVGQTNNQRNDMWAYSTASNTWSNLAVNLADSSIPLTPVDSSARWLDSNYTMWFFSGRIGSTLQYINELWALDVDECASMTSGCSAAATCTNTIGSYTCTCITGYQGDGKTCTNINECLNDPVPCAPHSACTDKTPGWTCSPCPTGYTGDGYNFCNNNNECQSTQWTNGSLACDSPLTTCMDTDGSWSCSDCPAPHWTGNGKWPSRCTDVNECTDPSLINGGCDPNFKTVCTNTIGGRTCSPCPSGYTEDPREVGTNCTDINECVAPNPFPCDPNAKCTNTIGGYTCGACPPWKVGNGYISCRDPPVISKLTPNLGNLMSIVTITGANFTNSNLSCYVGSSKATATYISSSTITCAMVDMHTPGTYMISVSQTSYTDYSGSLPFTFYAQETVTSLPVSTVKAGTNFTVFGTNFQQIPSLACRIVMTANSVVYPTIATFVSSSQIICQTPVRVAGLSTASVSNNGVDFPPGQSLVLVFPASFECSSAQESTLEESVQNSVGIFEYFPNLAPGSGTSVDGSTLYPNKPSTLFDGDRCCSNPINATDPGSCGVKWPNNPTTPKNITVVVNFDRPLWVNEILSSWYTPCSYEPRDSYLLSYISTNNTNKWLTFKQRDTTEETCGSIKGESGAVSLCIDFFDYITDAVAFKINWADADRQSWMYEFEVHGIYLDIPYYMNATSPPRSVTIGTTKTVTLPTFCLQAYSINTSAIAFTDSYPYLYAVNFSFSPALNFSSYSMANFNSGQACFTLQALSPPIGDYTITFASAMASIKSVQIPFTIYPGPAYQMYIPPSQAYTERGASPTILISPVTIQLLDVLGNAIQNDPGTQIVATWATGYLSNARPVVSSGGYATFSTLTMNSALRGVQTINFYNASVAGTSIVYNITTGLPYSLTPDATQLSAVCDSTIAIPPFSIHVFDSGKGELTVFSSTVFYIAPTVPLTLLGNATTSSTAPVLYQAGIVAGAPNLQWFAFTVESSKTTPPGVMVNVTVLAGLPRNIYISTPLVSIDITGPTITVQPITVTVKDFCGSAPNVQSATLNVRSLNSTFNFFNSSTPTLLSQDATSGTALVNMQFVTPVPGTYLLSFELAGVTTPAVLSVVVNPGAPYKFSSPPVAAFLPAQPVITLAPFSLLVLDVQGNLVSSAKITAITATVSSPTLNLTGVLQTQVSTSTSTVTFSNININMAPSGQHLVNIAAPGLQPTQFTLTITTGPPYLLRINSGNTVLNGQCGYTIYIPDFQVHIFDSGKTELNVADYEMTLLLTASNGLTVGGGNGVPDHLPYTFSGASVGGTMLNSFTITVSIRDSTAITDSAVVMITAGAPYSLSVNPSTLYVTGDTSSFNLPTNLVVSTADYCGHTPNGQLPTLTITSMNTSTLQFTDGSTSINVASWNGYASALTTPKAGVYALTWSAAGISNSATYVINVTPGAPSRLGIVGTFSTSYPAQPSISMDPLKAIVYDLVGNGAAIPAGLQMTISSPDLTLQGSTRVSVATDSTANFQILVIQGATGGAHQLSFGIPSMPSVQPLLVAITVTAGACTNTKLTLPALPLTAACESNVLIPQFTIRAYDSGNTEVNAAGGYQFEFFNSSGLSVFKTGFPSLNTPIDTSTLGLTVQGKLLVGSSYVTVKVEPSITNCAASSTTVTITPGTAHSLKLSLVYAYVTVTGAKFTLSDFNMQATDYCSNVVSSNFQITVTASSGLVFDGNTTVSQLTMTGVSTAVALTLFTPPAGNYKLTFSSPSLDNTVNFNVFVLAGAAYKLGSPSADSTSYAARPVVSLLNIRVAVLDINGNVATFSSSDTIKISVTGEAGLQLSGTTTVTLASAGNLLFDSVSMVMPTGGVHTLTFTPTSDSTVSLTPTSINITILPGQPYALQLAQSATNNSVQCQPVTHFPELNVRLYDSGNTFVTNSDVTVSVAVVSNIGGVTLSGTTSVQTVLGVATFNDLSVQAQKGASWVSLTFSATGLLSTTVQYTLAPGDATLLKVTPNATAAIIQIQGNLPYISVAQAGLVVRLADACGNAPATPTENVFVTPQEESLSYLGTSSRTTTIKVDNGKSDTSNSLPWILPAPSMGIHNLVFTKDSLTALLSVNVLAGSEYMLGINGSTTIAFPSDEVVKLPTLNVFFGDVKGNPVPTNNSRTVTGTFTSYPNASFVTNSTEVSVDAKTIGFTIPVPTLLAPQIGVYVYTIESVPLVNVSYQITIYPGGANKLAVNANNTWDSTKTPLLSSLNVTVPTVKIEIQDAGGFAVPFEGSVSVVLYVDTLSSSNSSSNSTSLRSMNIFDSWNAHSDSMVYRGKRDDAPLLQGTQNITITKDQNLTYVEFSDLTIQAPPAGKYILKFSAFGPTGKQLLDENMPITIKPGLPMRLSAAPANDGSTILVSKTTTPFPHLAVTVVDELGQSTMLPTTIAGQSVVVELGSNGTVASTNATVAYNMVPVRPSDQVRFSSIDVTASFTSIYLTSPPVGDFNLSFSLNVIGANGTNQTIYGSLSFTVVPGPAVSLTLPNPDKTPIQSDAYVKLSEYVVCALDAGGSYADIAQSPINITAILTLPDAYGANATATATKTSGGKSSRNIFQLWSNSTVLSSLTGNTSCTSFPDLQLVAPKAGTYTLTFYSSSTKQNASVPIVITFGDPYHIVPLFDYSFPTFNFQEATLAQQLVQQQLLNLNTPPAGWVLTIPPTFNVLDVAGNPVTNAVLTASMSRTTFLQLTGDTSNYTQLWRFDEFYAINGQYGAFYNLTFEVSGAPLVPKFTVPNLILDCLFPFVIDTTTVFTNTSCTCAPGYYKNDSCVPCPSGSYKPELGAKCTACPANMITPNSMDGATGCVCNDQTYDIKNATLTSDMNCTPCPDGGRCRNGEIVGNQAGYWRVRYGLFVKCLGSDNCILGNDSTDSCATGYSGRLCQVCSPGYAQKANLCTTCPKQSVVGWVVLVITIIVVGGMIILLLSRSFTQKSSDTVIIKIVITHIQTIALLKSVIIDWRSIFSGVASFANVVLLNVELVPANCIIPMSTYARFLIYVMFIPIGLLAPAVFYFGEFCYHLYKGRDAQRTIHYVVKKYTVVIATFNFIVYLTVTGKVLEMFQCSTVVDGYHYLNSNVDINCDTSSKYHAWRKLAEAVLVLYSVGIPLGILGFMIYQAKTKGLINKNGVYNLFADGFKPEYFFWEIVINLRKFLFVLGVTMLYTDTTRQLVYLMVISLIGLCAHLICVPHRWAKVWRIEMVSYIIIVLTIIAGMWVSVSPAHDNFSFFLSILTGVGNVLFVAVCVIVLARSAIVKLEDKVEWHKYGRAGLYVQGVLEKMKKKVDSPPELSKVLLTSSESQATFNDWWYQVSSQERTQFEQFLQRMDSFSRSPSMQNVSSLYRSKSGTAEKWYNKDKKKGADGKDIELIDSPSSSSNSPKLLRHLTTSQDQLTTSSSTDRLMPSPTSRHSPPSSPAQPRAPLGASGSITDITYNKNNNNNNNNNNTTNTSTNNNNISSSPNNSTHIQNANNSSNGAMNRFDSQLMNLISNLNNNKNNNNNNGEVTPGGEDETPQ